MGTTRTILLGLVDMGTWTFPLVFPHTISLYSMYPMYILSMKLGSSWPRWLLVQQYPKQSSSLHTHPCYSVRQDGTKETYHEYRYARHSLLLRISCSMPCIPSSHSTSRV